MRRCTSADRAGFRGEVEGADPDEEVLADEQQAVPGEEYARAPARELEDGARSAAAVAGQGQARAAPTSLAGPLPRGERRTR
jgi:hypothetical protein